MSVLRAGRGRGAWWKFLLFLLTEFFSAKNVPGVLKRQTKFGGGGVGGETFLSCGLMCILLHPLYECTIRLRGRVHIYIKWLSYCYPHCYPHYVRPYITNTWGGGYFVDTTTH